MGSLRGLASKALASGPAPREKTFSQPVWHIFFANIIMM